MKEKLLFALCTASSLTFFVLVFVASHHRFDYFLSVVVALEWGGIAASRIFERRRDDVKRLRRIFDAVETLEFAARNSILFDDGERSVIAARERIADALREWWR